MFRLWKVYTSLLQAHPFKAQATTTCLLMGLGDVISQQAIERVGWRHDVPRTLKQASFGLFIGGPALFAWYRTLDSVVKGTGVVKVLKMVATDQAIMAPLFLSTFFTVIGLANGKTVAEVKHKLRQDMVPTLLTNYKVWPAVQIINFYFVPLQHRVLVVNFVAVFWNTYLSWVANAKKDPQIGSEVKDKGQLEKVISS